MKTDTRERITITEFLSKYNEIFNDRGTKIERYLLGLWEITAYQYLKWATLDLEDALSFVDTDSLNYTRYSISALSNAKRALHRRVDTLLRYYWLLPDNKIVGFDNKINRLNVLLIKMPYLLEYLNKHRNIIEHKYKNPTSLEEIKSLISVVDFFLDSTVIFMNTPKELNNSSKNIHITFELCEDTIYIDDEEEKYVLRINNNKKWAEFAILILKDTIIDRLALQERLRIMGYRAVGPRGYENTRKKLIDRLS